MTVQVPSKFQVPRHLARKSGVRKDIQALRAIAVGLVVVNHIWPVRLPGGYVGVDVFFVISGYLISKHLLGELERSGRLKLGTFYARRAKRLLPVATLVAVVSLLGAWLWLPFSRWGAIAQETMAAIVYGENWLLAAKSVDYSAHNDAASTVQHYWSLSVEEQFYLIWPLLLLTLFVLASKKHWHHKTVLTVGLSLAATLSFIFCVWITYNDKSQAYFVTPARVWEFAVGALLAISGTAWFRRLGPNTGMIAAGSAQWLGYGLIAYSALAFNEQTYFPGFSALVPVIGTLLVIASGPGGPFWSPNTLFEVKPVQTLGDVSYSLYLWHWPLIILAPSILGRTPASLDKFLILAVAIGLSVLSKKYIEDPGRTRLLKTARPQVTLFVMLAAMAVVCALSAAMLVSADNARIAEDAKSRSLSSQPCFGAQSMDMTRNCQNPFRGPDVANIGKDEAPWFDTPECKAAANPITVQDLKLLTDCDFTGGAKSAATVWLVGDSHAEQWKTGIYELARINKWNLKLSMLGGCPFMGAKRVAFLGTPTLDSGTHEKCIEWGAELRDRIAAEKPDMVFVSSFGAGETIDDGTGRPQGEQYYDLASKSLSAWSAVGTKVFVIRDTPLTLSHSTPECVALNISKPINCANNRAEALLPDPIANAATKMNDPRIRVLDFSNYFCDATKCYAVIGGLHVYFDNDHAARSYIHSMVPFIRHEFETALASMPR